MRIAVIGLEKSKKNNNSQHRGAKLISLIATFFLNTSTVTFTLTGLSADQVFLFKHILIFNIVS